MAEPLTRRTLALLIAATCLAVTAAGCDRGPVGLPPDPPGVETVKDGAFTDAVRTVERQTREAVSVQLASRFGTGLHAIGRRVDSDVDPAAIKAHYEKILAGRGGWSAFPLTEPPGAWGFAFVSPDGRSVVAVIVLNPRFAPEGGGDVPFSILTNLPETDDR